ncbi:brain protein I3 isoform X2 [Poeciliopsis prolifica]|uniref:brain protein I3 isoform X2 n=1 Tax=Poeciliopsis prolifica TaxID=188132 RepID=UPI0024130DE0|nr:brain protein I3 isoform X2 [Poeciliopsis prolifica]
MVDNKPLLQDRPPAYNTVPGAHEYGPPQQPHGYGAIPAAAPPPYHYPDGPGYPPAQMGPAVSQQPYTSTYAIIQPSVVVVGGCPACSQWSHSQEPVRGKSVCSSRKTLNMHPELQ